VVPAALAAAVCQMVWSGRLYESVVLLLLMLVEPCADVTSLSFLYLNELPPNIVDSAHMAGR
jgi:hypothetical protein